jgi:uncharacterized protein (DUF302 family)
MDSTLQKLTYGSNESLEEQLLVWSVLDFDRTVERLKLRLHEQDLWLIHEIDPKMLLKRGGYEILATRQLLFFHPRYMSKLLSTTLSAIVDAPLKLVIMQLPSEIEGKAGVVCVRCADPRALFSRYPGLEEMGKELFEQCVRLLNVIAVEPIVVS